MLHKGVFIIIWLAGGVFLLVGARQIQQWTLRRYENPNVLQPRFLRSWVESDLYSYYLRAFGAGMILVLIAALLLS